MRYRYHCGVLVFLGCVACTSADTARPQGGAWGLEDAHGEPQATESEEPVDADEELELPARIEFEPGELSWAKPDHRVVFHTLTESNELRASGALDEIIGPWGGPGIPIEERAEGEYYHILRLTSLELLRDGHLDRYRRRRLPASAWPWPRFRGFYFPDELVQDDVPTLHLFEMAREEFGLARYKVGSLAFTLYTNFLGHVYIPSNSDQGRWFRCSARAARGLSRIAKGCEERYISTPFLDPFENVIWPGIDPQTQTHIDGLVVNSKHNETKFSGFLPEEPSPDLDVGRDDTTVVVTTDSYKF